LIILKINQKTFVETEKLIRLLMRTAKTSRPGRIAHGITVFKALSKNKHEKDFFNNDP